MIRLNNLKLPCGHSEKELRKKIAAALKIKDENSFSYQIVKRSVDARHKPKLDFVYVIDAALRKGSEEKTVRFLRDPSIVLVVREGYRFPPSGEKELKNRPVIIGFGPAGMFCGYMLAKHGYAPIILERGGGVEERAEAVKRFWETGSLDPECNVSFGEGGAGTFSDGKLNTMVKDKSGRNHKVLEIFTENGAPDEIRWLAKPHIGTDLLRSVVKNMREEIIRAGGEVRFHAKVTDILIRDGRVLGVRINDEETLDCQVLVLAAGHSARDTFEMLKNRIPMEQKAFAVGLRVQHPQSMINLSQYGAEDVKGLGPADYKLTAQIKDRGVYSFCMCPGGYVVNASSEQGRLAVNGMSNHARDSRNANSALIVTVGPEDFGSDDVLAGLEFQRRLEEAAFREGQGKIPVQLYGDFCENKISTGFGQVLPEFQGQYAFANLKKVLPEELSRAIESAMPEFGRKIKGFDRPDAVFAGIESRTSSPVRMLRDENGQSSAAGLYPCGEGAGYAGGITSAAMDGIRIAEKIAGEFRPLQ